MGPALEAIGVAPQKMPDMATALPEGPAVGLVTSSEVAIGEAHLAALPGLEFIGRAAAGTDNIDHAAARRRRIRVISIPRATAPCAAELTMAHIVSLLRRVPAVSQALRAGVWGKDMLGEEALGKRLGIVGLGRVGGRVARLAQAFGMKVLACDPYIERARFRAHAARALVLPGLLELADVVTLHTPLTDETRGFIGARELARMRPGSWLVNCARGGLVDETALLAALDAGHLSGAAIDTWMDEPSPAPLLIQHPAVLGTPHVGAATRQAKARLVSYMVREVERFLRRRPR